MRKLLFITYDFPPGCTSGIYRPVKFVKHLRKFGWEPIVLTAKNPYVESYDHTLLNDLPDNTKIYRAYSIDLLKINDIIYGWLFGKPKSFLSYESSGSDSIKSEKQSFVLSAKKWVKEKIPKRFNIFLQNIKWLIPK